MAIPEEQLETWSHRGALISSIATHQSIRAALSAPTSLIADQISQGVVEVYLQGSYKNDTNIYGDSDVDVVVQLSDNPYINSALHLLEQIHYNQFKNKVITSLQFHYGRNSLTFGEKSIKLPGGNGRLASDIVVVLQHKNYYQNPLTQQTYSVEGIVFYTRTLGRRIINFPKIHYRNGVWKHAIGRTNEWYKPMVRIFKNAYQYMVDNNLITSSLAEPYFIECLIYNADNGLFGTSYQQSYRNIVSWLMSQDLSGFVCQNGQLPLFGTSQEQWDVVSAGEFISQLAELWNNWS